MSISGNELMRRISSESRKTSEQSRSSVTNEKFKELMQVTPTDDRPREKGVFDLIEDEKVEDKEEENKAAIATATNLPPLTTAALTTSLSSSAVAASSALLQIEALFEKMATTMLIMNAENENATTLVLDSPQFASSAFFGSQITIREFSTAPKIFNVEILTSPSAIAALEAGKQTLLAAFQNGKFNFSVNRIDTHIQAEERPVLHRKDHTDQDPKDRKGDRE